MTFHLPSCESIFDQTLQETKGKLCIFVPTASRPSLPTGRWQEEKMILEIYDLFC